MKTKKDIKRVTATLPTDLYNQIKEFADSRGVGLSTIMGLSIQGGFIALKMASDPQWQRFYDNEPPLDENQVARVINGKKL